MIAHPPEKTSSEPRIDIVDDSGTNRQYPEMKPQDIQQPPAGMQAVPNYITIPNERRQTGFVFPVLLIGAGVLLLLNTMNVIDWNVWGNIWRLWPLALVAVGLELLVKCACLDGVVSHFFFPITFQHAAAPSRSQRVF